MFKDFAPIGAPTARIQAEILFHPVRDVLLLFSSRFKFYHVLRVVFYMGFICLAAPAAMLSFLTTVFPYILAAPGTPMPFLQYQPHIGYSDFNLHQGAFMFAPLLWATAMGIKRIHDWLRPRGRQGWLLAWIFLISGFGFKYANRTIYPNWYPSWFDAMPRVIARIPRGARLWVDGWASTHVSNRRWIKITSWGPNWPDGFESNLFKPDYVLIDKTFAVKTKPPYRDRMLTYFGQNGYRKIVEDNGVVLLESPNPSKSPEWVTMPPSNPVTAETYAHYLLLDLNDSALMHDKPGPDLARADNDLGLVLAGQGKLDEAIRHYTRALQARPDYAEAHENMGAALAGQGKLNEAIRHFELALRARPDYAEAHNNLGIALAGQGKLDAAIAHFRRALQIDPGSALARRNLEFALKQLEQKK